MIFSNKSINTSGNTTSTNQKTKQDPLVLLRLTVNLLKYRNTPKTMHRPSACSSDIFSFPVMWRNMKNRRSYSRAFGICYMPTARSLCLTVRGTEECYELRMYGMKSVTLFWYVCSFWRNNSNTSRVRYRTLRGTQGRAARMYRIGLAIPYRTVPYGTVPYT